MGLTCEQAKSTGGRGQPNISRPTFRSSKRLGAGNAQEAADSVWLAALDAGTLPNCLGTPAIAIP